MAQNGHKGLVQVFTGDGKGKTTAALGQLMRAAGHGLRTCVVFFMKGEYPYGEFSTLRRLNTDFAVFGLPELADPTHIKPEEIEQARAALAASRRAVESNLYDLIVLDEVTVAVAFGLLELEEVLDLVRCKPESLDLILTGRYADRRLVEAADLVTEMKAVKHPYYHGVLARKGVEF